MRNSSKTFIEGRRVAVYSNTSSTVPEIELSYSLQDKNLKLKCLELAVLFKEKESDASADNVCKIADEFYSYITEN